MGLPVQVLDDADEVLVSHVKRPYDGKNRFGTVEANLNCANADAINLSDNTLINIGDIGVELVNVELCNPTLSPQCWDPITTKLSYEKKKRAFFAEPIYFASPCVGQSKLRSIPSLGGLSGPACPSANYCLKQRKCCALVIVR